MTTILSPTRATTPENSHNYSSPEQPQAFLSHRLSAHYSSPFYSLSLSPSLSLPSISLSHVSIVLFSCFQLLCNSRLSRALGLLFCSAVLPAFSSFLQSNRSTSSPSFRLTPPAVVYFLRGSMRENAHLFKSFLFFIIDIFGYPLVHCLSSIVPYETMTPLHAKQ